jgi:hypothetical protein
VPRSLLQFQTYMTTTDGLWILDHLAVALVRGMDTPYDTLIAKSDYADIFSLPAAPVEPAVVVEAPANPASSHPNTSRRARMEGFLTSRKGTLVFCSFSVLLYSTINSHLL